EQLPQLLDFGALGGHKRLRAHARGLGRPLQLLAVLVRAREEGDVVSAQALVAREGVAHQGRVGVPRVQPGVGIIKRGCEVEFVHPFVSCPWSVVRDPWYQHNPPRSSRAANSKWITRRRRGCADADDECSSSGRIAITPPLPTAHETARQV